MLVFLFFEDFWRRLFHLEKNAPAAETKAEEVKTEAAEAAAPAAGEPAPAAHDISEGLEENLAKAGLTQVQTDASLAEPYSYVAVKYPGRPRPVVEGLRRVRNDRDWRNRHSPGQNRQSWRRAMVTATPTPPKAEIGLVLLGLPARPPPF